MTWLEVLGQSFALGLGIAMPVGPIGVLVIRRSLTQGRSIGIASGLGAASADGIYGLVATLGLGLVSSLLTDVQFYTRLIGGVFLLYLAWTIYRAKPSQSAAKAGGSSVWGAYLSTLALTLSNPATILFFFGVVAGLGVRGSADGSGDAMVAVQGLSEGAQVLRSGVGTLREGTRVRLAASPVPAGNKQAAP